MVKRVALLLAVIAVSACNKLDLKNFFFPLSTDVNTRVQESLEWTRAHYPITVEAPSEEYRFYVCSDIHVEENRPERFLSMVKTEAADPKSLFYQMLGDMLFGRDHMDYVSDIVNNPSYGPGFVIAGNHDLFYGNWPAWREAFHTSTYYYFVSTPSSKDLFIMLDSANGTLGEIQKQWLEDLLSKEREGCRHCFVSVHTNILKTDSTQFPSTNFTLDETWFLLDLMTRNRVDVMFAGHDHYRDDTAFNGVRYITLDDIKDNTSHASYVTVDVGDGVSIEYNPL